MTTVAAKLLDEFAKLTPDEQMIIRERVISLTETSQYEALNRLLGASAGKGLLGKLLTERARDRFRG